jgi:RNA polymerase sigma factor (sigma-70 family)
MNTERTNAGAVERLVGSHREFLAFLEGRIGDRAEAEDLLQDAFVRGIEHEQELRDGESARAWFYRMLRNAVVDRYRRGTTASNRWQELARALEERTGEAAASAERTVCACVQRLMGNLPPDQASALQRIELDGVPVKDFAREAGLTESNAGVRVFRARKALLAQVKAACGTCAEHGCSDCCCGNP